MLLPLLGAMRLLFTLAAFAVSDDPIFSVEVVSCCESTSPLLFSQLSLTAELESASFLPITDLRRFFLGVAERLDDVSEDELASSLSE